MMPNVDTVQADIGRALDRERQVIGVVRTDSQDGRPSDGCLPTWHSRPFNVLFDRIEWSTAVNCFVNDLRREIYKLLNTLRNWPGDSVLDGLDLPFCDFMSYKYLLVSSSYQQAISRKTLERAVRDTPCGSATKIRPKRTRAMLGESDTFTSKTATNINIHTCGCNRKKNTKDRAQRLV